MRKTIADLLNDVDAKGFWEYGTDRHTGEKGGHDMTAEDIAEYLLENGVTVQTWISVKDRLPDDFSEFLCRVIRPIPGGTYVRENRILWCDYDKSWNCEGLIVTHWMPLPEPPKAKKEKKRTNADRIRAMSDEELANIIAGTPICKENYMDCLKNGCDCEECLLKWLKQPAGVE